MDHFESMNLAIDQGNSSIKLGFFDKSKLIATYKLIFPDKKMLNELCQLHAPHKVILSSVTNNTQPLEEFFSLKNIPFVKLNSTTSLPFNHRYSTPETLGLDRVAAIAGAITLYPATNLLVIDAGTAITFDLVVNNTFIGGNISPGLQMRFNALHQQTQKLPLINKGPSPFWGTSTLEAIRSGVQYGIAMEIDGYIHQASQKYPGLKTIMTGGDADFFVTYTKNIIFVNPNLVLYGLNRILEYDV
ncbi:type III pantothenate kinase [Thermophagus xiamenensis]|uniref:Type III pantothenate kinase n=1 Tax=Thermophagus xiamenensis TaxID=385682 RepID=A0A1I1YIE5_9BACT|nr:type III pantothenate kinase [Thermophagus xiamenensis]SFE19365.1 type III pantothenate kinase [Thermophagus xiamenensis]